MAMMCDECGNRPATIRLMSITDGEKVTRNLCEHCLVDIKTSLPNLDLSGLDSILSSLLQATKKMGTQGAPGPEISCGTCGMSYEQFQQRGLLGCMDCYTAFREQLAAVLQLIHGQTQHIGRKLGARPEEIGERISLFRLRQQLAQAIVDEAYEQAAVLRDRIRELTSPNACGEVCRHEKP